MALSYELEETLATEGMDAVYSRAFEELMADGSRIPTRGALGREIDGAILCQECIRHHQELTVLLCSDLPFLVLVNES